jgi:isochorismate hydrolase
MSDERIEKKFTDAAEAYMSDEEMQTVIDTVWDFEQFEDVSALTELMAFAK